MKAKSKIMIIRLAVLAFSVAIIVPVFYEISEGCTIIGATGKATKDGNVYIAGTSDNPFITGSRKPVYVTIPEKGYKFVGTPCIIQDPPGNFVNVGTDRFMNEKGFSSVYSYVHTDEPTGPIALSRYEFYLKMATTVATVDEVIKFIKENPRGSGASGCGIFADAAGNLALIEFAFQTFNVVGKWSKNDLGIAARANRWETDKMKPLDTTKLHPGNPSKYYATSAYRYERAMELLNFFSGKIDVNILKEIMGDNKNREYPATGEHGKSISSHGKTLGTVSSEVYDPVNLTFWYTYGWPDGDYSSSNPLIDGANKNTWGAWVPFVVPRLKEKGFYTDWNGYITPMGVRYLSTTLWTK
jgi:hypothetical protein